MSQPPDLDDRVFDRRPDNFDICGHCRHVFGQHWVSFDRRGKGCTHIQDDEKQGGRSWPCSCKGFAIIWEYTG